MTRAVTLANLADQSIFTVDGDNDRVGIGSTAPTTKLDVDGTVTATSFVGDATGLTGVSGLGTAVGASGVGLKIYYTDDVLGIGSTVAVSPPASSTVAYTQYSTISVNDDADLIVDEGDDFIPDILGLEDDAMTFGISGSGSAGGGGGISNVAEDTTPQLGGNLDLNSKTIDGNGNININGTITATSFVGVGTADVRTSSLVVTTGIATFAGESGTTQGIHVDIGSENFKIFGGSDETYLRNVDGSGGGGSINIQGRSGASLWQGTGNLAVAASSDGAGILYYQSTAKVTATSTGVNLAGIASASTHVSSGIVTYYGDSSYSAAGRWVLGADGSNHYTFTGPGLGHSTLNDPTLYLMRGQTYMFENKMGAHPFRIQSTSNGSTGTQWNVGVTNNDVSNGVLIFEVPFVCPNTLYYQCTAHANMGGVLNIVT